MNIIEQIAGELGVKSSQVEKAADLIDEGNTIPFIARYRKEATGNLSDETLRDLEERLDYYRGLEERKEVILRQIEDQGQLTEELAGKIKEARTLAEAEDLYLPYKKKKKTRASIAEDKGYRPLTDYIKASQGSQAQLEVYIEDFIQDREEDRDQAILYAQDIIAGDISEDAQVRAYIRDLAMETAGIRIEAGKEAKEDGPYADYYSYAERVKTIKPHRVLAIFRAEAQDQLRVKLELDDAKNLAYIREKYNPQAKPGFSEILDGAIIDAYRRLVEPSINKEVKRALKDYADDRSIQVFKGNLRPYLMQSPIKGKVVLGMDPGFRTGCKLAVVSQYGDYLDSGVIYPVQPQERIDEARSILKDLIDRHGVQIIALGNGTASRETEGFLVDFLKDYAYQDRVSYAIVNESGASVYSASALAQEEFPDLDVTIRGAISIARRIQDPLAELVKIEPKHIGVGQYQHDVDQKKLEASLEAVVEDCVNTVGVDINTASPALLEYVAGFTPRTARNIISHKEEHGAFKAKAEIKEVKGIGPKTFEQCAGFFRVAESDNPLDNTGVHPESYQLATALLDRDLDEIDIEETAQELDVGPLTLADIVQELKKPGRDPRNNMGQPILRSDILSMEDLEEGQVLKGTVRNVVDFGAFVDIGVETDGLVHISEMSDSFIHHPSDLVQVGDVVEVRLIGLDLDRERISLSMKV